MSGDPNRVWRRKAKMQGCTGCQRQASTDGVRRCRISRNGSRVIVPLKVSTRSYLSRSGTVLRRLTLWGNSILRFRPRRYPDAAPASVGEWRCPRCDERRGSAGTLAAGRLCPVCPDGPWQLPSFRATGLLRVGLHGDLDMLDANLPARKSCTD